MCFGPPDHCALEDIDFEGLFMRFARPTGQPFFMLEEHLALSKNRIDEGGIKRPEQISLEEANAK